MKLWTCMLVLASLVCALSSQSALATDQITVGTTASLSGRFAKLGEQQFNGTQMWVHDINARGALLGRKVRLIHYDDGSDPRKCAQLYERLITRDKVDLLLGPYSSDLTLAASTVAEKHDFPMLATGAAAGRIWARGYRNIFGIDSPASDYMDLPLEFVKDQGLQRIALVQSDATFSREVIGGVRAQAAEYGLDIVFDEEHAKGSGNVADLIRRIKRTNPDAVFAGTYFEGSVEGVRLAKAQGFTPKVFVFTVGPAARAFGDALGADTQGIMAVAPWLRSARMPGSQDFSLRYRWRFDVDPSYHAVYGYAAGQVLEAAVRLAGTLEKDKVREQLGSMIFRSLLGNYRVDETGRQIGKQIFLIQWQDGHRRLILPENLAETSAIFPLEPWSTR